MLQAGAKSDRTGHQGIFATTHWSVIASAANPEDPSAQEALSHLCGTYWYPIYAYLRGRGYTSHDAQDLTQGFFLRLLQRDFFARAQPDKGRFRSYLLGALKHFVLDETERNQAQKRGGGCAHISFDGVEAEERFRMEQVDDQTPDRCFDRRWALSLLDRVMDRLRKEHARDGNSAAFETLRPFLVTGTAEQTYAAVAALTGQSEQALKKAVLRLRQRYHRLFWEEITQTVSSRGEAEEELHYLCSVIGN